MDNFSEKIGIDMKARIKVNIYKNLLEEEKHKNKRNSAIGLSLFIVGIVSTSALYQIRDTTQPQVTNRGVVKAMVNRGKVPRYLEGNNIAEMDLLDDSFRKGMELSSIKEEDFFVSDFKM